MTLGFPCGSAGKESACNAGDLGSIPGLGRSPGEGKGYPLQYSGLENPLDCAVHGVTKSRTRLSDLHFTSLQLDLAHFPCVPSGRVLQQVGGPRAQASSWCWGEALRTTRFPGLGPHGSTTSSSEVQLHPSAAGDAEARSGHLEGNQQQLGAHRGEQTAAEGWLHTCGPRAGAPL